MLRPEDLPVDPDTVSEDAQILFADDDDDLAQVLVILGQLNPTELTEGDASPMWSPEQQKLIVAAGGKLAEYQA